VIVLDTSILSFVFRRRPSGDDFPQAIELRALILADAPLVIPGMVLQELLSGVPSEKQFRLLRKSLAGFPLLLAKESQHILASQIVNTCRRKGIACSSVDALIAAQTIENSGRLFTTDTDFQRIASCSTLMLYQPTA
jgi:predicted nucleic acid-binding protein